MVIRAALVSLVVSALSVPAYSATATVDTLLGGGTLIEGDVLFDGFSFQDFSIFPTDTTVNPADITLTTSASASSVTLTASFASSMIVSGLDGFFSYFLDFSASIIAPSTRTITGVEIDGDPFHQGVRAGADVVYALLTGATPEPLIEVFSEDGSGTQISDSATFAAPVSSFALEGSSDAITTDPGGVAGYSKFALTFNLAGSPPPVSPVPLPAGLPLLLVGLGGLALLRSRRKQI